MASPETSCPTTARPEQSKTAKIQENDMKKKIEVLKER